MSPGRSLVRSLSYAFTVHGRTGRVEFWWSAALIGVAIAASVQIPRWTIVDDKIPRDLILVMFIVIATLSITLLTAACRRLHDSGHRTGWIVLIMFPFVGWAALAALLLMRGTHGPNQFGPDPAPWRVAPRGDHPALEAVADAEARRIADVRRYYEEMLQK